MKYSELVKRIAGDGADAWTTHYAARSALDRGEDVIILPSVSNEEARQALERVDQFLSRHFALGAVSKALRP